MNSETLELAPPRDGSVVMDRQNSIEPRQARRILVADDDELIRELVCTTLADDGFDAKGVADGEQAWEALHREHFDLLVTDHEMPRLDGIKLIERIRNEGMSLPVIVVSGSFSVDQASDDAPLQIAAMHPKPFDRLKLLDTVRVALRMPAKAAA